MPIITPAYPSMCATHNVTMSTKKTILRELKRGGEITDKIFTGKMQWKDLFVKHDFFTQEFKYYLSIVAASRAREAQHVWSGLVESKVRLLVSNLETQGSIGLARPFNKGFDRVHHCRNEDEISAVMNGDLQYQAKDVKTETTDAINDPKHSAAAQGDAEAMAMPTSNGHVTSNDEEVHTIYTTTYYVGIELGEGMKMTHLLSSTLTVTRVDKEARYLIPGKRVQRDLCWMAELQRRVEFAQRYSYPKVSSRPLC